MTIVFNQPTKSKPGRPGLPENAGTDETNYGRMNSMTKQTERIGLNEAARRRKELLPGAVAEYCLANFPSRIVAIKTLRNDYGSDWAHLSYCIGNLKTVYPLYVSPPNTVSHRDVHPDNFEEDNPQVEHIDTLRDIQRRMLDLLDELKDCSREIERNGNEGTAARLNSYVIAHLECAVTSEHSWLDSSTSIDSIIEELEEA